MMSEHSAHLSSLTFGFHNWLWGYTCVLLSISMLLHTHVIFESNGDKLSSFAECMVRTWKSQDTYSPADWMPTHKSTELLRIKLKTWTQTPMPIMSEHSARLTSLQFGCCIWLWRFTCLLVLISMLWHRQAIFESKGEKLSSIAECMISNLEVSRHLFASRLNAHSQTDWAVEDQAKNLNSTGHPYDD